MAEQELVDRPNPIAVFDKFEAELKVYAAENAKLVFAYDDPKGNKDARSHIYKLRQVKTKITDKHKAAKSEALAVCKKLDGKKNIYLAALEEMIDVHAKPVQAIRDEERRVEQAKIDAERAAKEKAEQERLNRIAEQEEELARKQAELEAKEAQIAQEEKERQAKIKAEEDRLASEREKFEAEKRAEAAAKAREKAAIEQAKIDKQEALAKAEQDKIDAVEAEKERARLAAEAKEKARLEAEAKAERERLAKAEAERVEKEKQAAAEAEKAADENHRIKKNKEVCCIFTEWGMDNKQSIKLTTEIEKGLYPALMIIY